MRRILLVLALSLSLCNIATKANPVGLEEARSLGRRFVNSTFEFSRQSSELGLVYSKPSFYVFNVGDTGFVILSADDSYSPVIGYSDEAVFNPDDMAPALRDYLDNIDAMRATRGSGTVGMEVANDWRSLREQGHPVSRHAGRAASYLVQTKWNQNYPYNYCCPADPDGPGGHVYAGCVATAGAQVMKYWNHPLHGTGSHTYIPEDNPQYGPITVNFGEATYDWDNMPNTISSASPIVQLEAIGQLIYHVGVSVDMNYRPTSSGAVTGQLCNTLPAYFYYTNNMEHYYRENYSRDEYMGFIINSIDMNWPMVHRGNGHAYVLDGYDDFGMVHFNWGWGGSNDGWFDIDGHNYADGESVICNCVPAEVYNATPKAPTNLAVSPVAENQLAATVTWNNPSASLSNQALTGIDQIVVMRNNVVVYTEDNVVPGAAMSFVDEEIPCFDIYKYTVYAICNGQRGKSTVSEGVGIGPTCQWKFVVSSTNFQGWQGSYIDIYNYAGSEVGRVTVTNSTPAIVNYNLPLGLLKLVWVPSETSSGSYTISINVKDADGVSVYNYSGNYAAMTEGVFFEGNNSCGAPVECGTPSNLTAVQDADNETTIHLQWTGVENPGYGYLIYRDDEVIRMVVDGVTEYTDEHAPLGGHCYQVATLCEGGMNGETSNMSCEASGACSAPRDFDFELSNNLRCMLKWETPEPSEGLSGYELYRKTDTTDYKRIKLINANATSYTDNTVHEEGDYYYKLVAYFSDLDCFSPPAAYKYKPDQYYVHFYYSVTETDEHQDGLRLYPNPTTGLLKIEAEGMNHVSVYNLLGQMIGEKRVNGDECTINMKEFGSGMFYLKIGTAEGFVTKKITVIE